ncbi:MAG: DUF2894 domain-containing protein [bacterium]
MKDPLKAPVADRLAALRAAGAAGYDGAGLRFVEALLERAAALDGEAATRLMARAEARLDALTERLHADRSVARALLATLQAADADPEGEYAAAFAGGDYRRLLREAELALQRARNDGGRPDRERLTRLCGQARHQGLRLPAEVEQALIAEEPGAARRAADQLAQALFRHVVSDARGTVSLARAADRLPAAIGPYNAAALAGQVLAAAEALSPAWLRTLLTSMEDLGTLSILPAPPPPRRRRR